jgi:hypothetical protein
MSRYLPLSGVTRFLQMASKKTICLDFDGCIHKYSKGFHDGTVYDEPMEGAFEAIRKLQNKDYEVVILTARPVAQVGQWFLKHWKREYGVIPRITNTKPVAIAYVDDKAIRFVSWVDVLNYF